MQYAPVIKSAMRKAGISRDRFLPYVFTHHNKGRGKNPIALTRVKLWYGDSIYNLPQNKQVQMLEDLKEGFGDKFHSAHFIPAVSRHWDWSFVVWLKP